MPPPPLVPPPSSWLTWHDFLLGEGVRVLDVACGEGRHSLAAAELGADVVALDGDPARILAGQASAEQRGLSIDWHTVDLEADWPDLGQFDVVLVFNYLDRKRWSRFLDSVAPGGVLIAETFLTAQKDLGWGPQSDEYLLHPGELSRLVAPLEILHGREVLEPVDSERWRAVASVVAERHLP
ncbi:MAG: class I SAM-dependent methyltransferase [Gemmatimonadales bacterium]